MTHSGEQNRCYPNSPHRNAVLASVIAVLSSPALSLAEDSSRHAGALPLCHDLPGHSTPDGSVWLEAEEAGEVVCIVDGDTFDVRLNRSKQVVRARIWGVDCPESSANEKCMKQGAAACADENIQGKEATRQTQALLAKDHRVTLEPPYNRNGNRKLTYVRLKDGTDFGRTLIERCLCPAKYNHARKKAYEEIARGCRKRGK